VQPGTSAILVILRKVTPDKFEEALRPYGGTVLRTSLSREQELMKARTGTTRRHRPGSSHRPRPGATPELEATPQTPVRGG
jgi:uncharacterized membrane protein